MRLWKGRIPMHPASLLNGELQQMIYQNVEQSHLMPIKRNDLIAHLNVKHRALGLLHLVTSAPKSVKCNTHHTIVVDADIIREIENLLTEVSDGKAS